MKKCVAWHMFVRIVGALLGMAALVGACAAIDRISLYLSSISESVRQMIARVVLFLLFSFLVYVVYKLIQELYKDAVEACKEKCNR